MHLVLHLLRLVRALAQDRTRLALENLALRQHDLLMGIVLSFPDRLRRWPLRRIGIVAGILGVLLGAGRSARSGTTAKTASRPTS
jgi:hypothetical protein